MDIQQTAAVPAYPIWRLSIAQYHNMIRAGILTDDDPVELLEGWLVTKMPKNRRYSLSTQLTREALAGIMPVGWYVDDEEPITMADSEPEPDVLVVRGDRRDYTEAHPGPDDVALVVEVADATLQRDRTLKLGLYASAGLPVYWILNLQERQLEAFADPVETDGEASYGQRTVYQEGDSVSVVIGGQEIGQVAVRDLLA